MKQDRRQTSTEAKSADSEWKYPENNNDAQTRPVLPSRCTPGWEVRCWRAAGGPPANHTGVLSNYKNLLLFTWSSEVSWKQKGDVGEDRRRLGRRRRERNGACEKTFWALWLTVTNWLFSSLMMSPTWTSIHFSLLSLQTGSRWLDCVCQCVHIMLTNTLAIKPNINRSHSMKIFFDLRTTLFRTRVHVAQTLELVPGFGFLDWLHKWPVQCRKQLQEGAEDSVSEAGTLNIIHSLLSFVWSWAQGQRGQLESIPAVIGQRQGDAPVL